MHTSWLALLVAPVAFVVGAPTFGHPSSAYRCNYGGPSCCHSLNQFANVGSTVHGQSFANGVAAAGVVTDALYLGLDCTPYTGILGATLSAITCPNAAGRFACCATYDAGLGGFGCIL